MAKLHYWKEHVPSENELEESMRVGEKIVLVPISEEHVKKIPLVEKGKSEEKGRKKEKGEEKVKAQK